MRDVIHRCFRFDEIEVDVQNLRVTVGSQIRPLEPKSFRLLVFLIENRGRVVPKDEIMAAVWPGSFVSDNSLTRAVTQVRQALGDESKAPRYIETVPTVGYRFIGDVVEADPRVIPVPEVQGPPEATPLRSRWALGASLAFGILAVLVGLDLLQRNRPNAAPSWSGTVLGGPIIASHPRISPDGQLLAFRAIIDGQSQVAVMKPDSSSWTALTHDRNNGAVASVAWSRDGSKIYFDREWGPDRIYAIGALGGEPRLVLENAWLPEPLPDGSLIAQRHSSEGREQLLHFWPDSGRTQLLPASARYVDSPNVRAFSDGREIAVFGLPDGASGPPRLFVLDLKTLQSRTLGSTVGGVGTLHAPIAILQDSESVLVQQRRGDTYETIALPRSGRGAPQTLISLPAVAAPISQDVAPDGSIYMDHSEFESSVLLISSSGETKAEIPIPQFPAGNEDQPVIVLPDGAVVFDVRRHGRSDLFLGRAGVEPHLLLNSPESAALPGALLGEDQLAFVAGVPGQLHMAIASLRDGSIIRRFPQDASQVTAVTAPADGQTIFYASNGTIWAQSASGGDPRRLGKGYDLAIEPSGKSLYFIGAGADGYELFRMPTAGGAATRVNLPTNFNLTPLPLSPSAVDASGRILLPVNLLDVFFYRAAIFDPAHNTTAPVGVPPRIVVTSSGWTRDGGIAARITRWSGSLWRYRNSLQNKGAK